MKITRTIDLGIINSLVITTRVTYRGFIFTIDKLGRVRYVDDIYIINISEIIYHSLEVVVW